MRFLEAALTRALGQGPVTIERTSPLAGGCIHEARRLSTSAGDFFAKWSAGAPPDLFLREAECLAALRSAGGEVVVPRVIAASGPEGGDPAFLLLEFLPPSASGEPMDQERLGRGLARIHRRSAERFGFPNSTYCGATKQDNRSEDSWPKFYGERRLRPLVEALTAEGQLSIAERRVHDTLMERLDTLLPQGSLPALIHGDLWSGNVVWSARGPALVDPACAYADREMEFGISTLFGGLGPRAMSAYQEAFPLPPGWRERNALYQLYHLLNHAVLFGGHYAADANRIARRYAGG